MSLIYHLLNLLLLHLENIFFKIVSYSLPVIDLISEHLAHRTHDVSELRQKDGVHGGWN